MPLDSTFKGSTKYNLFATKMTIHTNVSALFLNSPVEEQSCINIMYCTISYIGFTVTCQKNRKYENPVRRNPPILLGQKCAKYL
jgi:hypothetical protein